VTHELIAVTNTTVVNTETICYLLRKIAALGLAGQITLVLDNARYQRNAVITMEQVLSLLGAQPSPRCRRTQCSDLLLYRLVALDVSSATGQLRLLEYIPDRSKQQGRRFPLASISQALSIRFKRVFSRLADSIHWIQSLRATGVMSDHAARAFECAVARAFRRSAGTLGSGSSAAGAISSETMSPASAPAASRSFRSTLSQWPPWPSGSSVARKAKPLKVPSTDVMPREGSFALASLGRVRKVQATAFAVAAGRKSVALKRILEAVVESLSAQAVRGLLARDVPLALGFAMLSVIIRSFS